MKPIIGFFCALLFHVQSHAQEIEHQHSKHYALVENKGQWAKDVLFQSKSQGNNIWVQQHGFIYDIRDYSPMQRAHGSMTADTTDIEIKGVLAGAHFMNSNEVSEIVKEKAQPYYYIFFLGNDSTKWASDVRS